MDAIVESSEKFAITQPAYMTSKLAVAETFYSIQGEGQTAGIPSYFLRLAACNLMCGGHGTEKDGKLHNNATWRCDTIEVWLKGKKYIFPEVVQLMGGAQFIKDLKDGVHLVITGGEPLIQQVEISKFLFYLSEAFMCHPIIEIETNGTIYPGEYLSRKVDYWNVSPKLSNSGMSTDERINMRAIDWFALQGAKTIFKFVITRQKDMEEIERIYSAAGINRDQIWLMPGADNVKDLHSLSEMIIEECKRHRYRFSNRLHIQVWNKKTGV